MRPALGLLVFAALAAPAAAELSISAQVDKTTVALNDQVTLEVFVTGDTARMPEPQLPSLPNFSVYSSGHVQNISIVNGQVQGSVTYSFVLVPRFVGRAVIPPLTVEDGGKRIATQPIEVQVVRPSGQRSSGPAPARPGARPPVPGGRRADAPDLFVEASVDRPSAFVNEQVTLSVRVHVAVALLGNPDYSAPDTSGFFKEDLPPLRSYKRTLHERLYYVTEVKTALFAAAPGRHVIGPAAITAQVQKDVQIDPFAGDFFEKFLRGGGLGSETVQVRTEPVVVEILPLPEEGRPDGFKGAVGDFTFSASLKPSALKVGEPAELTLQVKGKGNLKTVSAPPLPEVKAFRVYDTLSSLGLTKEGDVVQGFKTFKTVLVARASGETRLPEIAFSFFDPKRRLYRTQKVGPIPISVDAGDAEPVPLVASRGPAPSPTALDADIHYLLALPLRRTATAALAGAADAAWLRWLPPLLWALCLVLHAARLWRARLDPVEGRFQKARAKAGRRLAAARREPDPGRAAALLGEALTGFLADKLRLSPHGLTLRQVLSELRDRRGLRDAPADELKALWDEVDAMRYAPSGAAGAKSGSVPSLASRLDNLMRVLDKEIES